LAIEILEIIGMGKQKAMDSKIVNRLMMEGFGIKGKTRTLQFSGILQRIYILPFLQISHTCKDYNG